MWLEMYMNIHVYEYPCFKILMYISETYISSNNLELGKPAKIRTPAESINASKLILASLELCSWVRTVDARAERLDHHQA